MLESDIRALDARCRAGFTYRINDLWAWRSYGDQILAGTPWAGDCSDLTSSVLDLMGRVGASLESRYRLLVIASDAPAGVTRPNHMVGVAVDDAGRWWIVGDTFDPVYPATTIYHQPVAYNRLSEIGAGYVPLWRQGAPWSAASSALP